MFDLIGVGVTRRCVILQSTLSEPLVYRQGSIQWGGGYSFHPKPSSFHPKPSNFHPKLSSFHPKLSSFHPKLSSFHSKKSNCSANYDREGPAHRGYKIEKNLWESMLQTPLEGLPSPLPPTPTPHFLYISIILPPLPMFLNETLIH